MGSSKYKKEERLLLEEIKRTAIKKGYSVENVMKVYGLNISQTKSSKEVVEDCRHVLSMLNSTDPYLILPHQESGIGKKLLEEEKNLRRENKWSPLI